MNKRNKKASRILALLLSMAMVLSLVPGIAMADETEDAGGQESVPKTLDTEIVAEGDGSTWHWVLDSDGTLTITGTGTIKNDGFSDYKDDIKSAVIEEGVTGVYASTFDGYTNLEAVTLPSTLTSIGNYAFYGCTSLESFEIPDNCTSLGYEICRGCTGLKTVTLGSGCKTLGGNKSNGNCAQGFGGCNNLETVYINAESGVTLGYHTFSVPSKGAEKTDLNVIFTNWTSSSTPTVNDQAPFSNRTNVNIFYPCNLTWSFDADLGSATNAVRENLHDWGDVTFDWSSDYASATATSKCTRCSTSQTVDAEVWTTNESGYWWYNALATFSDFQQYSDKVQGAPAAADKTALEEAIAYAEDLYYRDYTPDTWSAMQDVLIQAKEIDGDEDVFQETVDEMTAELWDAINSLKEFVEADKTVLNDLLGYAAGLSEDDYTEESWAVFEEALKAAETMADDELDDSYFASQEEVNAVVNDLWEAMQSLEAAEKVDKTTLGVLITVTQAMDADKDKYTPDTWNDLVEALSSAQIVYEDPGVSQQDVDDAVDALLNAIIELEDVTEPVVDKSGLEALIAAAEVLNQCDYTSDSWDGLQTALAAARSVDEDTDATQTVVDVAVLNLQNAIGSLQKSLWEGHDWGEVSWTWSNDRQSATASRTCQRDGCGITETVLATVEETASVAPSCTDAGEITYTATATFSEETDPVTAENSVEVPATGHTWGTPGFEWADDNSSATATRKCTVCGEPDTVDAEVTHEGFSATCTEDGETIYIAKAEFDDGTTAAETKTVEIPAAGHHTWDETEWTWSDDHSMADASRTCTVCNTTETVHAVVTSEVVTEPTHTQDGETTYTAEAAFSDTTETDSVTVTVDALGEADKTALDVAFAAADALDSSEYTSESWAALEAALSSARDVYEDPEASLEDVDAAAAAVMNAISELQADETATEAEKDALNAVITAADALVESNYTSDSWSAMQQALADAKAVLNNSNATEEEVSEAVQALTTAISNLKAANNSGTTGQGTKNGFVQENGEWHYYNSDGEQFTADDIKEDTKKTIDGTDGWYYIVNGKVDFSYTGVSHFANDYGWWYVKNGKVDFSKTSIEENQYGWWRVVKGKVDFSCNSVEQNDYGWWYVLGGKVQFGYTGVANYANANGWWYISKGKVDFSCNSVEQNDYGWWYVVGGKVDFGYTGVSNYGNAYGYWYIKSGKVDFSCNSVEQNQWGWWYVLGGKVQFGYTGVANYANAYGWWYISSGKVDFGYTGTASNNYGTWNVVNGKVVF